MTVFRDAKSYVMSVTRIFHQGRRHMSRVARLSKSIKPVIEHLEKRALMSAAAGDLDTTFGDAGIVLGWGAQQPFGWYYNDLRVLDDGKILAVGQGIYGGSSACRSTAGTATTC
jgi:hypothetical protein